MKNEMKIGPLEILVIFLATLAAGLVVRIFRGDKGVAEPGHGESIDVVGGQRSESNNRLKKIGLVLVLFGVAILIFGIGLFGAAIKAYLWAFIMFGTGLVLLMLSRGRDR